jgi:hypothetical protein
LTVPLLAGLMVTVTGCDPCAGTVSCETGPTVRASGRIVHFPTGASAAGVRVSLTAGAATAVATTDGDGFWMAELPAPADAGGQVTANAEVLAAGASAAYQIGELVLPVTRRRGDGMDVGRWYSRPVVRFIGELRARPGINLIGASVQVDRSGGVTGDLSGVTTNIGTDGRFYVEGMANATGKMTLRLTVTGPKLSRAYVRDGVEVSVMYRDTVPTLQGTYSIGSGLLYVARVFRRGPDTPLAGVTAVFRRRSGISVVVDSVKSVSTSDGLVSLQLTPNGTGEVVGDLELRPPSPIPARTITGIRLATMEDDSVRLADSYGVGVQVRYAFEFFRRSALIPAANVEVEFRPISGPLSTVITGRTNSAGIVGVTAAVTNTGTVVGDLTVRYLDPRPPEVRTGLRLVAAADDSVRNGGYLGVGPSLLYVGTVQDVATFAPVTSGTAEFRRTAGIAVEQAVFSWPINTLGLFRMSPTPLADGEVVGDVTLRLAAPYRDTTFTNVRLTTFANDSGRAGPIFRVRRP